ncbi:TetR family transcriptional regulator C-terminal domain-containing protein [Zoogloea sp.]|uniref:TetR/AcrR family transcriptional regulator n=1 Tax=Zoogloea sp. TaxID=49181 RepID=UPI0035B46ECD
MEPQIPPPRRGPKPKPHIRENLLRIGARMLHESGYTATGIKDIVDAAEVPKGSFYNYFESKEAFGREAVDFYFNQGLTELNALLGNEDIPPLERLRHYFAERTLRFQTQGYVRGCMLGNLSLEVADQIAPIRDQLAEHFQTWGTLMENCIADAQRSGAITNPLPAPVLARFLLNSWEGALLRMKVDKSDAPLTEFHEVVFGALLV